MGALVLSTLTGTIIGVITGHKENYIIMDSENSVLDGYEKADPKELSDDDTTETESNVSICANFLTGLIGWTGCEGKFIKRYKRL